MAKSRQTYLLWTRPGVISGRVGSVVAEVDLSLGRLREFEALIRRWVDEDDELSKRGLTGADNGA